jgi:hypothetical protein
MIVITIMQFARFVNEVWHETQRLRRTLPGPTEE